jgi:lipopolysaccharide export system protein LptA
MNLMTMSKSSSVGRRLQIGLLAAAVLTAIAGDAAAQSTMQGVPNAMQGFSQNRDQPIQIEAASLEMRDKKKEATFSGDVKVVQGDTTMKSKTLVVFYDSAGSATPAPDGAPAKAPSTAPIKAAQPGPGGSSSIKRLEARGGVVVTQKDQVVTGETAVFDTRANLITMLGSVVLTKCNNVLRGDRLMVDMTTGTSRVESNSGRVQGLFIQSKEGNCGPSAPAPTPAPAPAGKPK